ncbi:MAG: CBS domain-containing protein [Bacteroidetes bacterium]|nr:CBS domain-containing protein [Bacteroidota bacterium]MBU1371509.1 CBS domain-containing protein [Bacteroidota bacterium]MBU1485128.1 CBS domain-containing protein [Bacteroidota bacterium]MBU1760378.1 CBS domain-containing protein [Bacteroidota bacterium]MBU2046117.1 CBS domain-containing protein [Bacteroidota bacterium]
MIRVNQILTQKENRVITVNSEAMVFEALGIMMKYNISAILIVDDGTLKGIFTERDYARKVVLKGKSSKEVQIKDVMTTTPIVISPQDSLDHCMELMTHKHIRHLPVMDENKLTGMVSIGDVVKYIIEDQKQIIKNLESYINS